MEDLVYKTKREKYKTVIDEIENQEVKEDRPIGGYYFGNQ